MDKLANYGSDDDYDDSPPYKRTEPRPSESGTASAARPGPHVDANYDEVQMDMSEDSSGGGGGSSKERTPPPAKDKYKRARDGSPKRNYRRRDKDERERESKHRDRYREERKPRRSSSREKKQRSRSPRYRSRRSNSRDRGGPAVKSGNTRRFDRASNKMAQLEKLGIEVKTPGCQFMSPSDLQRSMEEQKRKGGESADDRFFMPGITGRFRDQIERRKMLWQKKEPEKKETAAAPSMGARSSGSKVWETTTFAQDTDGKVASKFKRLMGIKGKPDEAKPTTTDLLKKQEEMFTSMEAQYEVARTATHTMRGVGLGFGSFQR